MNAESMAAPTSETCFLCEKYVGMSPEDEFILTILSRNHQSSRLVFHTDCFFYAAGKEYKQALNYDKLKPVDQMRKEALNDAAVLEELREQLRQLKKQQYDTMQEMMAKKGIDIP